MRERTARQGNPLGQADQPQARSGQFGGWLGGERTDFATGGGTVLLSSHLLAEIQATADHLVIIDQGRVVARGTQASLLAGTGQTLEELSLTTPKETVR
jgi:hypothetical protein